MHPWEQWRSLWDVGQDLQDPAAQRKADGTVSMLLDNYGGSNAVKGRTEVDEVHVHIGAFPDQMGKGCVEGKSVVLVEGIAEESWAVTNLSKQFIMVEVQ